MVKICFEKPIRQLKKDRKTVYKADHYYLNDNIKTNLDIIKGAVTLDWDFVIAVDGIERSGKSLFAQQLGFYLDPTLDLDRIVFSGEEFEKACLKAKQYECIIWDEAITGANIREAMAKVNVGIMRMLGMIGQKNLFIIIVLPTFYDMDRYIALFRSRALFHIYAKSYSERGFFQLYKTNKNKMWIRFRKYFYYPSNMKDFEGRFYKTYCVDEVLYREKKAEALTITNNKDSRDKRIDELLDQRDKLIYKVYNEKLLKTKEIGRSVGLTTRQVYNVINEIKLDLKEIKEAVNIDS